MQKVAKSKFSRKKVNNDEICISIIFLLIDVFHITKNVAY